MIEDVRAPWSAAAGWNAKTKTYEPIPYHTLTLPLIQYRVPRISGHSTADQDRLNFTNMYLGIAQGALEFARYYSVTKTRGWPISCGASQRLARYSRFFSTDFWQEVSVMPKVLTNGICRRVMDLCMPISVLVKHSST